MNTTISSMAPLQEQMNQCIHTIQQVFIYLLNSLLVDERKVVESF